MQVRVLFFGILKEMVGKSADLIDLPDGASVRDLLARYQVQNPRLKESLPSLALAVNQQYAGPDTRLSPNDEVALLPPVSGGSGRYTHEISSSQGHFYALTRQPIDSREVAERLLRGEDGAVVVFEGVVRNNTKGRPTRFLEYECYEAMAVKMMAEIGGEIAGAFEISRIAMVHRLGRLEIGEASVAIIVTAPHRKAAFAAALEGINRLKRLVPIWKKEHFADGEVWVEGEWDEQAPKVAHG